MLNSELDQLVEDVIPLPCARMPERHPPGHHLVGDPAESTGDLDTQGARILALEPPSRGQDREVFIAFNQIICNHQDRAPQVAVGVPHQRTVAAVNLIALIPRGEQPGPARDRSGLGVALDRPHLAGELGGRDDVDPDDAQEEHIGRPGQQPGQFALDRPDAAGLRELVGVELEEDPVMERRRLLGRGGGPSPGDDLLEGGPLDLQAGLSSPLAQAGHAGIDDRRGRAELPGHPEGGGGIEDVRDAPAVSWHERLKMLEHLLLERDALLHRLAAVPGQQLESDVDRVGFVLRQAEAVDGGAMDGGEVSVVRLVTGIGGEPILLGGVGVDDADLEPGLAEGAPDRPMIAPVRSTTTIASLMWWRAMAARTAITEASKADRSCSTVVGSIRTRP